MIPTFEVNLAGLFNVSSAQSAILDELPDAPGDVFPAPGPFHPTPSNQIAQTDQTIHVHTQWTVSGGLAPLIDGTWKVDVYVEKYGTAEAPGTGVFSAIVKNLPFAGFSKTFNRTVSIPAGSLDAGLYKVALAITFVGPAGQPLPVAGFAEMGMIQYYDAV